jgi:hypothetical protein
MPRRKTGLCASSKKGVQARQGAGLAETRDQVVAIVLVRMIAKVGVMPVARQGQPA